MNKLAVLIDADNTPSDTAQALFEEIAKYGTANVKRIYGDWSSQQLNSWRNILLKHALVPMQQFAYTKGKDATDMGLIIDAMDLLYSGNFNGFCLVSSDSDFTPLASRIRTAGLLVYGFGRKTTPEAFRQACDRFFYIENLGDAAKNNPTGGINPVSTVSPNAARKPIATNPAKPRQIDNSIKALLYKAIKDATTDDTGWAFMGQIGNVINQTHPDFDSRSYGYSKLSGMLRDLQGLQFRNGENNQMLCRKIPFGEIIKLLDEATHKFKNARGWSSIDAVKKYIKPRWNWEEYGFESFLDLLSKIDHIEVSQEVMRIDGLTKIRS